MAVEPEVYLGNNALNRVAGIALSKFFSQVFVLVDENTVRYCYPEVKEFLPRHHVIEIKSGEEKKNLTTCELIWRKLTDENADRKSLLINIGGGVICDLGGFAAATYKRGIKFLNIPTTLMAMVDASVGGKTGIDFLNFKNQIGVFADPEALFFHTGFLKTLPDAELYPAFAEIIKHYLIADAEAFYDLLRTIARLRNQEIKTSDLDWDALVGKNIAIKMRLIGEDKFEAGPRRALNFGHTIGHAIETYYLNRGQQIAHGTAVAIGILCESRISLTSSSDYAAIVSALCSLPLDLPEFPMSDVPDILRLIRQDKKNSSGLNQFTLLNGIGNFSINNFVEDSAITDSLQYYYELTTTYDPGIASN